MTNEDDMKRTVKSGEQTGSLRPAQPHEGEGLRVDALGLWQRLSEFEDLNKLVVEALETALVAHGFNYDRSRGFFIDPIDERDGAFEVHVAIGGCHQVVRVEALPDELRLHAFLVRELRADGFLGLFGEPYLHDGTLEAESIGSGS